MVAIILDILGAYFLSKTFSKWLVLAPLAIVVGIASAILSNFAMYHLFPGGMTAGESAARAISSSIWHPIITIAAIWIFRRKWQSDERNDEGASE